MHAKEFFDSRMKPKLEEGKRVFDVSAAFAPGANIDNLRASFRGLVDAWAKENGPIPVDIIITALPGKEVLVARPADTVEHRAAEVS